MSCFKKHWSPFSDILKTEQLKDSSRKPTLESVAAARICSSVPSYEWPFSLRWHAVHILISWSLWHSIRSITSNKTHTCLLASSPPINPSSLLSALLRPRSAEGFVPVSVSILHPEWLLAKGARPSDGALWARGDKSLDDLVQRFSAESSRKYFTTSRSAFFPPSGLWTCSF